MSDRWEPFDSQHMASRDRTMMRGQRQLVVVTGGWMEVMGVLHGSKDRRCQRSWTKPPNQPPESITQPIYHPSSFVVGITVAS